MGAIVGTDGKPLMIDQPKVGARDYGAYGVYANPYSGAGMNFGGGIHDDQTGLGGAADKSVGAYFAPTLINNSTALDTLYNESWAAGKFVDMPIDDMFLMGRVFENEDEALVQEMVDAYDYYDAYDAVSNGLKCGRLYGSGFVVLVSDDGDMTSEMMIDDYKEDQLQSVLTFDRFDTTIEEWYTNPLHRKYGKPSVYSFTPSVQAAGTGRIITREQQQGMGYMDLVVHESRVIRFDGRRSITSNGWTSAYDRDWGISELIAATVEILHDATFASAIAHLAQEASIPVVKVEGLKETLAGGAKSPDDPTVTQLGEQINMAKSIYKTVFMDLVDEFSRETVTFHGLAEVLDRFALRLAAMAGIPATRFLGRSPAGMNATGESDANNYSIHVGSMQNKKLRLPMKVLDTVIAASRGITKPLEARWLPLADMSEKERAEVSKLKAETVIAYASGGLIDENEGRNIASQDEFIGDLPEWSAEKIKEMRPPEPDFDDIGGEGDSGDAPAAGDE